MVLPIAAADPAAGVGFFAAIGAGIVSFLSPCVLPLVPGYLSAVTGIAPGDLERADWRRVVAPSLLFIAAFSVIFVILGLTATGLGQILSDHRATLENVSGILIIALGVLFVVAAFVPRLGGEWHVDALLARAGRGGPVAAGAAVAVAWTPCLGPSLGAILTAAAASNSASHGALLLVAYSAGLGIPFLATALAFSRMTTAFAAVRRHYPLVIGVGGAILIGMGVLILTGEFTQLNVKAQELTTNLGINP